MIKECVGLEKKKKILIVRFRQIGDSVLASPICNTLKKTYPNSEIDYVIYDHIAPLFENHHAIDNVISITKEERKNPLKYIVKAWKVTRKKYDIIIDIMSTPKSEVFTLFGRSAKYRIGTPFVHSTKVRNVRNCLDTEVIPILIIYLNLWELVTREISS